MQSGASIDDQDSRPLANSYRGLGRNCFSVRGSTHAWGRDSGAFTVYLAALDNECDNNELEMGRTNAV
jgi:hypothetical protein